MSIQPDAAYTEWKSWDTVAFGHLSRIDAAYYEAEIGRGRPVGSLSVLEIGFGHGAFMAYARQRKWQVTGIEINAVEMKAAARSGYRVFGAIDEIPVDERFDLVVAFDVLEHLDVEQMLDLLAKLHTRLTPIGRFIARFPNGDSPFGLPNQHGDMTHRTVVTRSKLTQIAAQAGFSVASYRGERTPILCGHGGFMVQRLISVPLRATIDVLVNAIFLPTKRVPFSAQNAVAVMAPSSALSGKSSA